MSSSQKLPTDIAQLHGIIEDKNRKIARLEEELRLAYARRYGRSAEQYADLSDRQGWLFDEEELEGQEQPEAAEEKEVKAHTRKVHRGKRKTLPEYLERERVEHSLAPEALIGPEGEQYVKIGEEVSEQLEVNPATVKVIQNVRFKYAVKGREELGVKIAPLPGQMIDKSVASPGLLAHVAQAKYCYHLPLYRQEKIWAELDVHLPRNSLCRWMMQVGERLSTLVDYQLEEIKQHRHVHVDETPVTVIEEKGRSPEKPSHKGYMWVYTNHLGVVYDYQSSRSGAHPQNQLDDFKGYIQTDAFRGYDALFKDEHKTSVACMAHARRKFLEVDKALGKSKKKKPNSVAKTALDLIAKLYHIESQAKKNNLSEAQLYQLRQDKSLPLLNKLFEYLESKQGRAPPSSTLGKAIAYTLNRTAALKRYTEDGTLNIDNNPAERAIKPFVVGRKNWLFHGNTRGAKAAANIYSLIESAKLYHLKIFDYLKFVFERLPEAKTPKQLEALLPMYAHEHLPKLKNK